MGTRLHKGIQRK